MNYRNLGKIDAMELLSVIILAVDGDFKQFLGTVIYVFGFQNGLAHGQITKAEFHYFLDCMFRGVL